MSKIKTALQQKASPVDLTRFRQSVYALWQNGQHPRHIELNARVLTLDWPPSVDPKQLANFESQARRLRLQALGRACRQLGISDLFLAHHADDQAETVLMRLIRSASGFKGIKDTTLIPECEGHYGLYQSGSPLNAMNKGGGVALDKYPMIKIESGGIQLHRPLLSYHKSELIATCKRAGIEWFEDSTNKDRTLTQRNTIRYLMNERRIPLALGTAHMLDLAARSKERYEKRDGTARQLFRACSIGLNLRSGKATVLVVPLNTIERIRELSPSRPFAVQDMEHVAALLVRRLLLLVSPQTEISLQDLSGAVNAIFPEVGIARSDAQRHTLNVACVQVTQLQDTIGGDSSSNMFSLSRANPAVAAKAQSLLLNPSLAEDDSTPTGAKWTQWQLWDGRYWIRVRLPPHYLSRAISVAARFLEMEDLAALRARRVPEFPRLVRLLKLHAPGPLRWTLPVIVERSNAVEGGATLIQERVVALPSLGWSIDQWFAAGGKLRDGPCWELRYKAIDLDFQGANHRIG
ncbi:hypothetical protein LTR66_010313 [Elasticomyces elasticus]|nr:hypothetical protein LTR66_010313 [Elasticomyces elasticus]